MTTEESLRLQPMQACREFCRACVCGESYFNEEEVENCTGDKAYLGPCPMFRYRLGVRTIGVLKAMRKTCLQCMGDNPNFVSECETTSCAFHQYRFGNNPHLTKRSNGASAVRMEELRNMRKIAHGIKE